MKILIALLSLCLSGFVFSACDSHDDEVEELAKKETQRDVVVGDSVPKFSVTLNNGLLLESRALKGRVVVITFFNSSCGDCRRFLPSLESFYRSCKSGEAEWCDVEFLTISRAQKVEDVEAYWAASKFTMPYSAQADRTLYNLFAKQSIPRVYVVDRKGVVAASFDDSNIPDVVALRTAVKTIL